MSSESQLAFIFLQVCQSGFPGEGGKARVQNGASGSCVGAVSKLIVHEGLVNWESLSHSFTKEGLLQLLG